MSVKIQPQSGLGDLLFTLPLIEKLVDEGRPVTVATNHSYVLAPYGDAVQSVPIEIENRLPVIQHDAHHLRYDRYGKHYFKTYFDAFYPDAPLTFKMSVVQARARFREFKTIRNVNMPEIPFCVLAPPRAAKRHKHLKPPALFECAPSVQDVWHAIPSDLRCVLVGNDEIFAEPRIVAELDYTNVLTFWELVLLMQNAERVISQISAITALAGLLGVKTNFLPARTETAERHAQHIAGVVWPGQEVVK